jgi:hypothetical protein
MKTYTEAYIMGMTDERKLLREDIARPDWDGNLYNHALAMLQTCERLCKQGFGGNMAEYNRGARDFWRHQVKIHLPKN